jgi:hypothetical protein
MTDYTREMRVLCKIRKKLMAQSTRYRRGTPSHRAYKTAADVLQYTVHDYPGGRDFFWTNCR